MKKQWRCFFCDELFTSRDKAALHFGAFEACEADEVACKLLPHQEKVLKYIRECERQIKQLTEERHDESHPLLEALRDLQYEMASREKTAEEKGYTKGVSDMMKQGLCPEPQKHQ